MIGRWQEIVDFMNERCNTCGELLNNSPECVDGCSKCVCSGWSFNGPPEYNPECSLHGDPKVLEQIMSGKTPESPQKKDPEGTGSMSKKEYSDRQDTIARDLIGEKRKETDDPEGTKS